VSPDVAAVFVAIVAVAGVVAIVLAVGAAQRRARTPDAEERAELVRLTDLVEDLKVLAWNSRSVDPRLSRSVIEMIRRSETDDGGAPATPPPDARTSGTATGRFGEDPRRLLG
jgi:hypothetical protein